MSVNTMPTTNSIVLRTGEDIELFLYHGIHYAPSFKFLSRNTDAKDARTRKSDTRSKSQTAKDEDQMNIAAESSSKNRVLWTLAWRRLWQASGRRSDSIAAKFNMNF